MDSGQKNQDEEARFWRVEARGGRLGRATRGLRGAGGRDESGCWQKRVKGLYFPTGSRQPVSEPAIQVPSRRAAPAPSYPAPAKARRTLNGKLDYREIKLDGRIGK